MQNKLINFFINIAALVFLFLINEGIWAVSNFLFLILIPLLVAVMIWSLIVLLLKLRKQLSRPVLVIFGVVLLAFLIFNLYYDVLSVTHIFAFRYGASAQAEPIHMIDPNRGMPHITYQYTVDGSVYRLEQHVTPRFFQQVKEENIVPIRYVVHSPSTATVTDEEVVKYEALLPLILGWLFLWFVFCESPRRNVR